MWDVGCGSRVAIVTMAEAFPQSDFHGWEIAPLALDRCRENAIQAGVTNAMSHDVRNGGLQKMAVSLLSRLSTASTT